MNVVDEVAAKLKANYNSDLWLGQICWYGISEDDVRPTFVEFNQVCGQEGLLSQVKSPRPVDVFKRACKTAERARYVPAADDLHILGYNLNTTCGFDRMSHINYLVRNAGQDQDSVWRVLVREVVDSDNHAVGHTNVAKLGFMRAHRYLQTRWETAPHLDIERDLLAEVSRYYTEETETITTNAIRNFITTTLEQRLVATRVRSTGGVFFVRNQFAEQVEALERVVTRVGGEFHSHPLIDDSKQREMVRLAFEAEAKADIDVAIVEMTNLMAADHRVTKAQWVAYNESYEHHRRKIREFSDILDASLGSCAAWLEVMRDQLDALLDHVDTRSKVSA